MPNPLPTGESLEALPLLGSTGRVGEVSFDTMEVGITGVDTGNFPVPWKNLFQFKDTTHKRIQVTRNSILDFGVFSIESSFPVSYIYLYPLPDINMSLYEDPPVPAINVDIPMINIGNYSLVELQPSQF